MEISLLFSYAGLGDVVTVLFYRAVVSRRYSYCSVLQGCRFNKILLLFSFTGLLFQGDIVTVQFYRTFVSRVCRYCSVLQDCSVLHGCC